MTVSVIASGQAYSNNATSITTGSLNTNSGDMICVASWMDVSGSTASDSAGQTWDSTGTDIGNDSGRFLRVAYLLSSSAQSGMTLSLGWGGTNHFGGIAWLQARTDTGSFSFDKTVGVAGTFNTNPVTIGSFNTTGAGIIILGATDYYEGVGETLDVGGSFTRNTSTAGSGSNGAGASFSFITSSSQTGVNPSCTATSPGGSSAIGFAGGSFIVSGGGTPTGGDGISPLFIMGMG